MKLRNLLILFICFTIQLNYCVAQFYNGNKAKQIIPEADIIWYRAENQENPSYIKLAKGYEVDFRKADNWLRATFNWNEEISYFIQNIDFDNMGLRHFRCQQTYKNIPVRDGIFILHTDSTGKIISVNGNIYSNIKIDNTPQIPFIQALAYAIAYFPAEKFNWEIPSEEKWIKDFTGDVKASWFPKEETEILKKDSSFIIAWKLDIYAHQPLYRKHIYIDASTGEMLLALDVLHSTDVPGTTITKYSGTQALITDSTAPGSYRLRETGRGNGIETYDMNEGTNYGTAVDFTDNDNFWNNVNAQKDEIAGDAHWGTEMTYDYYLNEHGRNSIDNNGFKLISYVHYDHDYANAFWNGQVMTYGDGSGSWGPLTALDITAHEITHGLTQFSANLDYIDESGALSEAFSDIFGTCVEFYAKPAMANWTCGEDIGVIIRSLENPNSSGNPDTYWGTNWDPGGEVHQNSTVGSHWFYILTVGDTGTNDNTDNYAVAGQGIDKAADIAYRTLTVYLINSSDYSEARFYSIISATDIFGGCTPELEATTNAWYAVGVGNEYITDVIANFTSDFTSVCSFPATVQFSNTSVNGSSYLWDFGDGDTSTLTNPSHIFSDSGTYDITLYCDGGACGKDTTIKVSYITISPQSTANVNMPAIGQGEVQDCCTGTLYDSGGDQNYANNTNSTITISPQGAINITLNFNSFAMESGYDYLYIYDGPNTSSQLIGQYDGYSLPNGGLITSSGNSITLKQYSDQGVTAGGFEINWQCNKPDIPTANFTADITTTCTGLIQFSDLSANIPDSWLWDFGDGNSSTNQNPLHSYNTSDTFTVKLIISNSYGIDSMIKTQYVIVNLPVSPNVNPDTICDSGIATLSASGNGVLSWYDTPTGGTLLDTGTFFNTTYIDTTTTFYVQDDIINNSFYGGKANLSGSGGYYGNPLYIHYEIFDCYIPLTLVSTKVYASGSGNRTILLRDSAMNVLEQLTVYIPDGESRVILNFNIPAQNNLQLVGDGSPDLWRNNNGSASYPYTVPGYISIKESSASFQGVYGNYYYFYNWELKEPTCSSAREPVDAIVLKCNTINEIYKPKNLEIHPNPASNKLYINYPTDINQTLDINIFNIAGQCINSQFLEFSEKVYTQFIDISKIHPGFYFITIDNGEGISVSKIIIQR